MDAIKIDEAEEGNKYSQHQLILYNSAMTEEPATSNAEREKCLNLFTKWSETDQVQFVKDILSKMCGTQHGHVNLYLQLLLQRDFISLLPKKGLQHVAENILFYLDAQSLCRAELVCTEWLEVISEGKVWKKLLERKIQTDSFWKRLAQRGRWIQYLFKPKPGEDYHLPLFYKEVYAKAILDIKRLEHNWRTGRCVLQGIDCESESFRKGVYCLQYDNQKIVSGFRDYTIKVWDKRLLKLTKVLRGHSGSVVCLQYNDKIIISGSTDSTIRVWDVNSGKMINTIIHHTAAILCVKFNDTVLVACSKDRTITVWDITSPTNILFKKELLGHISGVNAVDFDEKYIVSGSADSTIKVWNVSTYICVRTLYGHKGAVCCMQYKDNVIVSGGFDKAIRLWDVESGACLRILTGHGQLVRCLRFDSKRIVSGDYDGKIKVWDFLTALNPRVPENLVCLQTLTKHTDRVIALQFDEFEILSGSCDDKILTWIF